MKLASGFFFLVLLVCACAPDTQTPVDDVKVVTPASQGWLLHGRDWKEQRHSPLVQISTHNAQRVGLVWEYDDFIVRGRTHRGMEATPIVKDGVMYLTGPWSVVYALDAKTGDELWYYDPDVDGAWARKACCDAVNRGVAVTGDLAIVGTLDGYLDAVDTKSGARVWRTDTLTDRTKAYTITGAPRLAGNLVIIGNGGAELGVRGYFSAHDVKTGELVWRFYTVPGEGDAESDAIAFAKATWGDDTNWEFGGGGTVWDSMTYDPELDIIYVGVGNGSPWPKWNRDPSLGDNLYLSSILAVRASTGELVWYYQTTPGDSWDYTATQNIILSEIEIDGERRKVLMQAPKNGFFYVIDRENGELLSADAYTHVTWADGIDMATGRPRYTELGQYADGAKVVWPGTPGGHNWQPMAYHPETGLVYIPVLEMPQKFSLTNEPVYRADTMNVGADVKAPPFPVGDKTDGGDNPVPSMRAVLKAWDPVASKVVWESDDMSWWGGGVLTTLGGLVVQGGSEGVLKFYHAKTGALVHSINIGTGIMSPPISYQIDGQQYIAVTAGYGGAQLARLFPGMAALEYENYERVLVFKLNGAETPLPPKRIQESEHPIPKGVSDDPEDIAAGLGHYKAYCGRCHAPMGAPNGYPDLWNLSPESHAQFSTTVLDGSFSYAGMTGFSDALDEQDVDQIQSFIVSTQKQIRENSKAQAK